jgi:hypothetical protein
MEWLGHAIVSTTTGFYVFFVKFSIRPVAEKLSAGNGWSIDRA